MMTLRFAVGFLLIALAASIASAKLPDVSNLKESEIKEVTAAVEQFRKTTVGASPEFRKEAIAKLKAVIDKYPDLKSVSEKLGKLDPKDDQIRLAMSASDRVKFIVFDRASGKEVYSLWTSPDMANYYKSGLESNPAKCGIYGCQIVDGQQ